MHALTTAIFILFSGATFAYGADDDALRKRGEALVRANCAVCHSIDAKHLSPHPEAPQLSTLASRYPIDFLAEALAEGLTTGHPDMPEFAFPVDDVTAILAYVKSIQQSSAKQR